MNMKGLIEVVLILLVWKLTIAQDDNDLGECNFTNSIDGVALNYVDRVVNATTREACRDACREETFFTCRSISFINQGEGRKSCYLSADTRRSLGAGILTLPGSVYEEYVCERIPTPPPTILPSNMFCEQPEDYAYERANGIVPRSKPSGTIDISKSDSPTLDCLRQCLNMGDVCLGVAVNYSKTDRTGPTCSSYNTAVNCDMRNFAYCSTVAFFSKICIKGIKCESLWTIERKPHFALVGFDFRRLENITSAGICAERCLRERMCNSMQYFVKDKICRLSSETRRTKPNAFRHLRTNVQYLENQCIKDESSCKFTNYVNRAFRFIDKRIPSVSSLSLCQTACNEEKDFMCRSVTYNLREQTCSLSACDLYCASKRRSCLTIKSGSTFSVCSRKIPQRPSMTRNSIRQLS